MVGVKSVFLFLTAALLVLSCSNGSQSDSGPSFKVVTARDLTGTYTGVLEGITVPSLDALKDTSKHTLVNVDLLHQVTATSQGDLNLTLQSSTIPKTHALMVGLGDVAINLAFIDFEGLSSFPSNAEIHYLQVKNIVFVKYNNEWIPVIQIARIGFPGDTSLNGVFVYQYVAYPKATAQQMNQNEAIQYVNTILKLMGST